VSLSASTLLFIDASCLFAAANSPEGGSGLVLSVCMRGYLQAVVSPDVLIEAERNITNKLPSDAFARYRQMLADTPFVIVVTPPELVVRQYMPTFVEDAHVVAAMLAVSADYLLTHDRRLARRVQATQLPTTAVSPKVFIEDVLPHHPSYASIRPSG
jgi:predicted nucleic acid-binding protein